MFCNHKLLPIALLVALCSTSGAPSIEAQATPSAPEVQASENPAPPTARRTFTVGGETAKAVFPPGRTSVELPFRLDRNKILVPVTINGKGPFDFVLDTGASSALFDAPSLVDSLDLSFAGQAQVGGAGDGASNLLDLAMDVTFGLGEVELPGNLLAATPSDRAPLMPGGDWHGVFGHSVFSSLVVEIDWRRERLRLTDPAHFEPAPGAQEVPLTLRGGHSFVEAGLRIDGGKERTIELVVDTGANHALSLAPKAGAPAQRVEETVLGYGLNGPVRGSLGRVSELRLGATRLANVVTTFPDKDLSVVVSGGSHGNLGAEVLRRFHTTFDYANRRLLIRPTPDVGEPFSASTSGVYVQPWLDEDGTARVVDVFEGSPAERSGIAAGDQIVEVDGRPIAELTLAGLRERLEAAPGTQIELLIARGEERRRVRLALEALI